VENLFTRKNGLYSKYTVREWKADLQQDPKEKAFANFTLTSHRQAAKGAVVKRQRDREKERMRKRDIFIGRS